MNDPERAAHERAGGDRPTLEQAAVTIAAIVGLLWVIEVVDVLADHRLDAWGVRPHTFRGLRGIPFAPLLHYGFRHLLGNTIPFAAMGWLILSSSARRFVFVTVVVVVVSGLGMWLFGSSDEMHLGASGVVFGYLGYLLSRGFFERKLGQIAVGIVIGIVYGGMLWGVLPTARGVSWQGHLFGFIGGVLAARMLAAQAGSEGAGTTG